VTLPMAARYADVWNTGEKPAEQYKELNAHLDSLLDKAQRPRSEVRRSMMIFLRDDTPGQVKDRVQAVEAMGVQRVMLNWSRFDDIAGIANTAKALGL